MSNTDETALDKKHAEFMKQVFAHEFTIHKGGGGGIACFGGNTQWMTVCYRATTEENVLDVIMTCDEYREEDTNAPIVRVDETINIDLGPGVWRITLLHRWNNAVYRALTALSDRYTINLEAKGG